jgi:hypothetical protein
MNNPPPILRNGSPLDRDLTPKLVPIDSLKPLGQETRKHPKTQIRKLARNLETYGFVLPIVIDGQGRIVHGAALVEAARLLELIEVPAVVIDNLDEARLRALRLNLNRLAEDSSWDDNALRQEFDEIQFIDSTLDLSLTGFETAEIDLLLSEPDGDEDDMIPDPEAEENPVTVSGDLWGLGEHCILCGDAKDPQSYAALFGGTEGRARTVITDPPYNVEIDGHVCGSGQIKHSEFVEAAGEKSQEEFRGFLSTGMRNAADYSDRWLVALLVHGLASHPMTSTPLVRRFYGPPQNLAVWVKTNAGMGSLYRSQHELVGVFKSGKPVMRSRKSDEVFNDYLDSLATLERQALVAEWTLVLWQATVPADEPGSAGALAGPPPAGTALGWPQARPGSPA